ncbi:hypothetical protein [Zooshikella sp. RANM57]|uniref:hypothetical protein n=1 Tax=Zooshikella sp. RANM57 TaxID=3425863 RepID=UPI003D6E41B2
MADMWYDFSENMDSVEWISELPTGMVSERINLQYQRVELKKVVEGYIIYIGPAEPDKGGEGIVINLDTEMNLTDYVIERIEPVPFNNKP